MSGVQLLTTVFAIAMMYQSYLNFKKHDISVRAVVFWELLWVGLLVVTVFPGPFQTIIGVVHVARLLDFVIVIGILVFGAVTYSLYVRTSRLRNDLDAVVRAAALAGVRHSDESMGVQASRQSHNL